MTTLTLVTSCTWCLSGGLFLPWNGPAEGKA